MNASNFMHGWITLLGSLAVIAIILIALGLMTRIVKPAMALKHVGATLGIVIVLMLLPGILVNAWSAMPLWQRIALVAIGVAIWRWRQPHRHPRRRRDT